LGAEFGDLLVVASGLVVEALLGVGAFGGDVVLELAGQGAAASTTSLSDGLCNKILVS